MKNWKKIVLGIVATPFVLAALLGIVYGDLKVKKLTFKVEKPISKVSVFYPEELKTSGKKYPI